MFMREKNIRKLIEIVEESEIDGLELSSWGRKIKITRRQISMNGHGPSAHNGSGVADLLSGAPPPPVYAHAGAHFPSAAPQVAPAATPAPVAAPEANLLEVKSPMVGTYYSAPSPDAPPYVKTGDNVSVGQVVCIVEAMKLMNEIESEVSGKVVKILVSNAQPVEFGQALFLIDPAG